MCIKTIIQFGENLERGFFSGLGKAIGGALGFVIGLGIAFYLGVVTPPALGVVVAGGMLGVQIGGGIGEALDRDAGQIAEKGTETEKSDDLGKKVQPQIEPKEVADRKDKIKSRKLEEDKKEDEGDEGEKSISPELLEIIKKFNFIPEDFAGKKYKCDGPELDDDKK